MKMQLCGKLINAVIKDVGENNVKLLVENEDNFNPKTYRKKNGTNWRNFLLDCLRMYLCSII